MKKYLFSLLLFPFFCCADTYLQPFHDMVMQGRYERAYEYYTDFLAYVEDNRSKGEIPGIMEAYMGRSICAFHLCRMDVCRHDLDEFVAFSYCDAGEEGDKEIGKIYESALYLRMSQIFDLLTE